MDGKAEVCIKLKCTLPVCISCNSTTAESLANDQGVCAKRNILSLGMKMYVMQLTNIVQLTCCSSADNLADVYIGSML